MPGSSEQNFGLIWSIIIYAINLPLLFAQFYYFLAFPKLLLEADGVQVINNIFKETNLSAQVELTIH